MAPRIFITGITGYIGGDVSYRVHKEHPDYEYAALIRTREKADGVKKLFPKLEAVIGGLDDYQTIKQQAAKADIVIHTADASDHEGAAKAIAEGLAEGHSKDHPGYWLHTGGTGILTYVDTDAERYGESSDKVYNDWAGIEELINLPDHAFHRNVDKIVLEAGTKNPDSVKTALICPPTIYGKGRGPTNSRSRQAYELSKVILTKQYVPVIGKGKARWNQVHVQDLAEVFALLVDAAVTGTSEDGMWGEKAYYIVENGEFCWGQFAQDIGQKAAELKLVPNSPEVKSMSKDEAFEVADFQAVSWGLNSRARGERARKLLGWEPSCQSIYDEIPDMLKQEHERLRSS